MADITICEICEINEVPVGRQLPTCVDERRGCATIYRKLHNMQTEVKMTLVQLPKSGTIAVPMYAESTKELMKDVTTTKGRK